MTADAVPPPPRDAPSLRLLPVPRPATAQPAAPAANGTDGPRLDGLRIAVLNWRDPWQSVAGGAEEYAWRISRDLLARGASVTFVTSREAGQARSETREGVAFRRMGGPYTVYPRVLSWLACRRRRFDAVLDCMNGIPFFAPTVVSRRTSVVSVVHHVHDLQFNAYFSRPVAWLGRFIEGPVASRIYRSCPTVTVSASSRDALRAKLGWRAPIVVIHNGGPSLQAVAGRRTDADPTPLPGTDRGSPALVSLGRLVVQKRVTRIVSAVDSLQDAWPGLRAHIVGRGPEREPLSEEINRRGLGERVKVYGFLPEADKNAVLAGATLHVTASQFEGWGLTVLEAARLGVPTVAYDVDGLRDAVRHGVTGWLVRDGETLPDVVHRALTELSDPERAHQVSEACRAWAARFTWQRSGREMAQLIASLRG